ncbi:MAG TPA: DUF2326 domain-containing protein [Rhodopirellula baltica]|uniref:DUF2326 domain-containing protein n=1 Tax=Rhodopirellula baltica (strain DSM 10527 / NCIMB 13988 / SH1) TaxID=243090 RepID=Q7UN66_RHOBA|nr:DUF2326 domain-containing protein [Rhodopirellula baltica]CAD75553.1 conserved hypothetical protein [Rhodopirellula baltica SH 1]HBE65756.1 DUF2326 domain-containing protein [Rhodopirellula baltica]
MLLRLHRLSSEPECFDPIEFHTGVNLILGERSDGTDPQGRKLNGVGKSVCVDFLHFALGRRFIDTRLSRIPEGVLPEGMSVLLDLSINDLRLQIRRSTTNPDQPTVVVADGSIIAFDNLDELTRYLGELLFAGDENAGQASFRSILSLLMRDERSEFKSVVNPSDTARRAPDDYSPHLFLMGIDSTSFAEFDRTVSRLDDTRKFANSLKKDLTDGGKDKLSDIPAKLNEEKRATEKIEDALETLRVDPAFEKVEEELNEIELELRQLRSERKKLSFQIDQIRSIPLPEQISADDIAIVFERVRSGLGELVEKSLEQAKEFKESIEKFQQTLRQSELTQLQQTRTEYSSQIRTLSDRHAELVRQVDNKGVLAELRTGLEVATRRTDQYHRLASQFDQYERKAKEINTIKADRSDNLRDIQTLISECDDLEASFNETLVAIHESIQQTSRASFKFRVDDGPRTKKPLSFDVRIQDDGSHSVNHARVFIYDFALMLNELTSPHHPKFLLHDNILEVDQDTLVNSLNFIQKLMDDGVDFQYILTLNRDILDGQVLDGIDLDIDEARCAKFTKSQQFLKTRYQEQ